MRRATGGGKALLWTTGGVAAIAVVLTGYAFLHGGGGGDSDHRDARPTTAAPATHDLGPSIAPTYTVPPDWTEPVRWAALPRGARTDARGHQVAFPHTPEGAAGMMLAANSTSIDSGHSAIDVQVAIYQSYMSEEDKSPAIESKVRTRAAALGPFPAGAYVHTTVVGYKIISSSPDQVSAWLLTRSARKEGETQAEQVSYSTAVLAVEWQSGDWKLSTEASQAASDQVPQGGQPAIAAPGDVAFNSAGWTAIREAS